MQIRLAAYLQPDSIVDGDGIRTVIWTQGCPHNCLGCHNPNTHSMTGGQLVDVLEVCRIIDTLEGQDGITFSGGDPFVQPKECAYLAKYARSKGYNIWCYTGYTYEQLLKLSVEKKEIMDFLKEIDILIDGKFVLELKSFAVKFAGSTNQRMIDVKKSLAEEKVVTIDNFTKESSSNRIKNNGIYI